MLRWEYWYHFHAIFFILSLQPSVSHSVISTVLLFSFLGRWKLNAKRAKIDDFLLPLHRITYVPVGCRKIFYYYLADIFITIINTEMKLKKMIKMVRRRGIGIRRWRNNMLIHDNDNVFLLPRTQRTQLMTFLAYFLVFHYYLIEVTSSKYVDEENDVGLL